MADFTRIDWQSLKAARRKCRQFVVEVERGRDHRDLLHTAYKLSAFLHEALPDAWDAVEVEIPDGPRA